MNPRHPYEKPTLTLLYDVRANGCDATVAGIMNDPKDKLPQAPKPVPSEEPLPVTEPETPDALAPVPESDPFPGILAGLRDA